MNRAELLGLYYIDRRHEPRIFKIRQYLNGVYLIVDGDEHALISGAMLENDRENIFATLDRARAALNDSQRRTSTDADIAAMERALADLSDDDYALLQFIANLDAHGSHAFEAGVLEGQTLEAVSLLEVQIASELPLPALVESIVVYKKLRLLEVVSEPVPGKPEEEDYWLIINPSALGLLRLADTTLEDVA